MGKKLAKKLANKAKKKAAPPPEFSDIALADTYKAVHAFLQAKGHMKAAAQVFRDAKDIISQHTYDKSQSPGDLVQIVQEWKATQPNTVS
ncbi:hypothetical protein FRB97_000152 [Tulasnella sp. 331]